MSAQERPRARGSQRRIHLPVYLTSFVGREGEIGQVERSLELSRLVTLIAPGGVGKTRLGVRVAQEVGHRYRDGAHMVDFASVGNPTDVAQQVALTLGLDSDARSSLEVVMLRLQRRHLLLLLDSCEHVRDAVADLCRQVLMHCSGVRILATSRERLGLEGEALLPVPPLSLPNDGAGLTVASAARCEALWLFVERAISVQPNFALSPQNVRLVADICTRLEGIPLAIELAAARTRMLSLQETLERVDDRFRLLTGGPSGRHETLLATIEWSHRLLREPERCLFRRLAAFPSGFRFEAAEQVAKDLAEDILDLLGSLVDKSFLQLAPDPDGRTRYRMLESLRQYGLIRLSEYGEGDAVQSSHFEHYMAMAEIIAAHQDAPDWDRWLDRLEADHDNFRAALTWSLQHDPPHCARLASMLGWFWQRRGYSREGRRWIETALAVEHGDDRLELDLLHWASILAAYETDWAAAARHASRALALQAAVGYRLAEPRALVALGNVAFYSGNGAERLAAARQHYLDALRVFGELGAVGGKVSVLLNLCLVELLIHDLAASREHASEAMALSVDLGWGHHQQAALGRLGMIALVEGNLELAGRFFRQGLHLPFHRMPAANGLYLSLKGLACVMAAQGKSEQSALLLGAAYSVAERDIVKSVLPPELEDAIGHYCQAALHALGQETYESAYQAGTQLSEAEAIANAAEEDPPRRLGDPPIRVAPLSNRELEIARLASDGLTNREISQLLCLSTRTVDSHLDHIRNKLGLHSRTQIVKWLLHEDEAAQT